MATIPAFTSDADWSGHYGADGLPHGAVDADLKATATGSDLTVTVAAGQVLVQDMRHVEASALDLDLTTLGSSPTSGQNSIDLVVARLTRSTDYTTEIDVVPGTPATAGSEARPSITRDSATYEVVLASVLRQGTAAVTQADITDERPFRERHRASLHVPNAYSVNTTAQWLVMNLNRDDQDSAVSDGQVLSPGFRVNGRGIQCSVGRVMVSAYSGWTVAPSIGVGVRVLVSDDKLTSATGATGNSTFELFTERVTLGARAHTYIPMDIEPGQSLYLQVFTDSSLTALGTFRQRTRLLVEGLPA